MVPTLWRLFLGPSGLRGYAQFVFRSAANPQIAGGGRIYNAAVLASVPHCSLISLWYHRCWVSYRRAGPSKQQPVTKGVQWMKMELSEWPSR